MKQFLLSALIIAASISNANEVPQPDVFNMAVRDVENTQKLIYPRRALQKRHEGWVDIDFVVGADGTVSNPTVVDSSGGKEFIKRALNHLRNTPYTPATLNGEPVESSQNLRYRFEMNPPAKAAGRHFYSRYRNLQRALKKKDQQAAEASLSTLRNDLARNLYEDAFLNIGAFEYYRLFGTKVDQVRALNRAVGAAGQKKYLPADTYVYGLANLLKLLLETKHYQQAIKVNYYLSEFDPDNEYSSQFAPAIKDVLALKKDDRIFSVDGNTSANGRWFYDLLKPGFSLEAEADSLEKLNLRCRNKSVFVEALIDSVYLLPESYGTCRIEIEGTPNTDFVLLQFSANTAQQN